MTEIVVEGSAREPLRRFMRERHISRYVVLCDVNVRDYARTLTRGIPGRLAMLPFALGERRKRLATLERVLEALVACGADRTTTIVGVGGGVASDLFGFAASLYMRGVPYIHVATSLVAMVDAAIGGKTGVDLASGKNLAGTFSDPIAMFAHVDALQTLPYRNLREGLAEVVKHGIIEGGDLFDSLETLAPHPFLRWPWESIVADAQNVKRAIVADDRMEHGIRETLNLGHTFGHGLERASNYRVSHGAAVSIGLRAAGLLALRTGRFSPDAHLRVITLLTLLRMPLWTRIPPAATLAAMSTDKKKRSGRLRFVLPREIGDVEYGVTVSEKAVSAVLHRITLPPGGDEFQ
ncbi:MAG TPA: 3-dehydroquinate synthase family protein [Candidatus Baltobacteraceae bacterium]|nr:3-dehydroquinate synthase family protein [Candidatus Baltobacteraceae bacterium]